MGELNKHLRYSDSLLAKLISQIKSFRRLGFYLHFIVALINKNINRQLSQMMLMLGPELDMPPEFNSRLPGLNFRHRFEVDPTWAFPQCISKNTKAFFESTSRRQRKNLSVIDEISLQWVLYFCQNNVKHKFSS